MKITNQQQWSEAIAQAVALLAECNKFAIAEQRKHLPNEYAGLEQDSVKLANWCAESADACGLFEMVADKIQGK